MGIYVNNFSGVYALLLFVREATGIGSLASHCYYVIDTNRTNFSPVIDVRSMNMNADNASC